MAEISTSGMCHINTSAGRSTSQNNHHPNTHIVPILGWVNIPEWWVNIKQNGGSTWNRIYNQSIKEEFDTAEEYFNKKDYNKCVAHCRNVLDVLNRNLKKRKNEKPIEPSHEWLNKISKS